MCYVLTSADYRTLGTSYVLATFLAQNDEWSLIRAENPSPIAKLPIGPNGNTASLGPGKN